MIKLLKVLLKGLHKRGMRQYTFCVILFLIGYLKYVSPYDPANIFACTQLIL